ncbi:MAG: 2,3-bisphosphoglycerate-independent phosphoglycerate mutase [Candidatus Sumerlaeota bacterium]|nr:2,3-bisphosphoglycerate-independent phosphoglycerate mutase [Candidatus Sumerlaeota bacterium]
MKYVIFLGDGMADEPHERLGGRTPLQAAKKPTIDRLAREGRTGLFRTLQPDMATGSAVANLSVMGFDPRQVFQGRGVLEAASMGVDIGDAMAMRCNLICLNEDGTIKNHSAGHISSAESNQLLDALRAELPASMKLHTGVSYRHLFVGQGLNPAIDCAPPHDHPGEKAADLMISAKKPEAEETARVLNELILRSQEILRDHPVNKARRQAGKDPGNSIWLWSPGQKPKMWTYEERFGVSGGVISAVDLIFGIGVYAGLEKVEVEGATGLFDTNYEGKADACLDLLKRKDFCYLHVEAPDEAGHEGDLDLKIRTIEDFDARCVARVLDGLDKRGEPYVAAVLPDHPTPVAKRIHTRDPIPFAIRDPRQAADAVQAYDEVSCRDGALGIVEGDTFIRTFFGK